MNNEISDLVAVLPFGPQSRILRSLIEEVKERNA